MLESLTIFASNDFSYTKRSKTRNNIELRAKDAEIQPKLEIIADRTNSEVMSLDGDQDGPEKLKISSVEQQVGSSPNITRSG